MSDSALQARQDKRQQDAALRAFHGHVHEQLLSDRKDENTPFSFLLREFR